MQAELKFSPAAVELDCPESSAQVLLLRKFPDASEVAVKRDSTGAVQPEGIVTISPLTMCAAFISRCNVTDYQRISPKHTGTPSQRSLRPTSSAYLAQGTTGAKQTVKYYAQANARVADHIPRHNPLAPTARFCITGPGTTV